MFKLVVITVLCLCADLAQSRVVSRAKSKLVSNAVEKAILHSPEDSKLLGIKYRGPFTTEETIALLPDNSTLIYDEIVGGFDCTDRIYGYYADMENKCKIFHLCFPLNQVFEGYFRDDDILHFLFVCPMFTRFSQDSMVCAWEQEAVPCEASEDLYNLNSNFFVIDVPKEKDEDSKDDSVDKDAAKTAVEKKTNRYRSS